MTTYTVTATATNATTDTITVSSATNMFSGMPIVFSGTTFGGITAGATYYIGTVVPGYPTSTITVTSLPGGAVVGLTTATGVMTGTFSSGGQQIINIGTLPNDGTGDPLRTAFNDTNLNFDQVFAAGPVGSNIQMVSNTIKTTNTNGNLVLAPNGTGMVKSNVNIVPDQTHVRNLGAPTLRWNTIYSYNYSGNGSGLTGIVASANIGTASKLINEFSEVNIPDPSGSIYANVNSVNITVTTPDGFLVDGNVTVNGAIALPNTPSGAANTIQYGLGNLIGYLDGQWTIGEYNGAEYGTEGIRINPGIEGAADVYLPANQNANVEALTVSNYAGNVAINTATGTWTFGADRSTIFPNITVQRGDNPSGTISGQTLLFGDATQEAIISTPDGSNADGINSQRLVINPGKGEDSNGGEGGDIYLWAGRGGNNNGSGGDVKIRGGYAPADGTGGYIRMDGGESQGNGAPGFIEITGGQGGTTSGGYVQITGGVGGSGTGGAVDIIGGFGQAGPGAAVSITGGGSANGLAEYGNVNIGSGASTWSFRNNGTTIFPTGNITSDTSLQLTTTFGNYRTVEYQTAGVWDVYVEDVATGPNDAWSWIDVTFKDNLINKPQVFIENQKASDGIPLRWTFDENGNLTLPSNIASINYANGNPYGGSGGGATNLIANGNSYANIATADGNLVVNVGTDGYGTWTFETGTGNLIGPGNASQGAGIVFSADQSVYIREDQGQLNIDAFGTVITSNSGNVGNTQAWDFGSGGDLTLPQGGVVSEGPVTTYSGNAVIITPADGGNIDQQLAIYPTGNVVEGNHLHLTTGNLYNTELYLGSDNLYVKLANTGNIVVNSNDAVGNSAQWTFGTDGRLINLEGLTLTAGGQFNICTIVTGGSGYNTGSALKATTGGSGTGMTVGIGYGLSNQLASVTVVNPGSGYVNGDVITVSEGTGGTFVITQYNVLGNQGNNNFVESNWTFDTAGNLTVPGGGAVWTLGTDTVGLTANIADPYQVNLGLDYAANTATLAGNSSVYIQTNSGANSWAFGNTGNTTFPNGAVFTGYDLYAAANSYVELAGSTGNTYMGVGNDGAFIQTDWNGAQRQWSFSETGNLTLPAGGNLIVSSGSGGDIVLTSGNILGVNNISTRTVTLANGTLIKDSSNNALAIGYSGAGAQGDGAIAIGTLSGNVGQAARTIAIGYGAGEINQSLNSVAVGNFAGAVSQQVFSVAIGNGAGYVSQGSYSVAIGAGSANNNQGNSAVAIGKEAGQTLQGFISIAIGAGAGGNGQGQAAVAIGTDTGANIQGIEAIAIGFKAANQNQGQQSIAIGKKAGYNNQGNNSIILNATGDALDQTTANTFTVAPVRNDNSNIAEVMFYNTSSKEITYGNTISVAGNITAANFIGNGATLSNVATQVTGSWDVPVGNSTQSFTVNSGTYSMWVDCNISNGILVWNATATVTNTNVPVIGQQFAWVYNGGGTPIDFTSIPNQFVGTSNTIVRSSVAPSATTNRFDFGIRNTSGGNVTVRYGWTKIS